MPLQGSRLIEHIILSAKSAQVVQFKIVVGYKADLIQEEVGTGKKYGVNIEYIFNPDWEKGNGISVYQARHHFKDNFLLLMGDHIFDKTILQKVLHAEIKNQVSILCVDSNLNGKHINLDDASKVWTDDTTIKKIGKKLKNYNAIDSGIFHYSPLIFQAVAESIVKGDDTLNGGNQVLSDWGKLKSLDISQYYWIDVDEPRDLQAAKEILVAQSSSKHQVL